MMMDYNMSNGIKINKEIQLWNIIGAFVLIVSGWFMLQKNVEENTYARQQYATITAKQDKSIQQLIAAMGELSTNIARLDQQNKNDRYVIDENNKRSTENERHLAKHDVEIKQLLKAVEK